MKNLLLLVLLVLFYYEGYSQSIKITYSEKEIISQERLDEMPSDVRDARLAEMKIPKLFILECSDSISFYQKDANTKDFNYKKRSSTFNEDGEKTESTIIVNKKNTPFFYYKELNKNLLLFKLTNSEINFDGQDKLLPWNWEILNETKVISGYNCKKAVSKAFSGNFTAWFTEDIPVNAGPEKFDGLPGLILYINTGAVEFVAEKIEILTEKIVIKKPEMPLKTVTLLEMFDIATKKHNDFMNSKKREGVRIESY